MASETGAVLIFDEVMTSRLAPGGLQEVHGILPDMTTFGKYVGGGMSFGAFGGKAALMEWFDPRRADGFQHAGTFNNNVLTMNAGYVGLTEIYTPERARALNDFGDGLRERLNAVVRRRGLAMQFTGIGSMIGVHMTDRADPLGRRCRQGPRRPPRPVLFRPGGARHLVRQARHDGAVDRARRGRCRQARRRRRGIRRNPRPAVRGEPHDERHPCHARGRPRRELPGRITGSPISTAASCPEREVVLPFRDRGFKYGDAAFDMTRTFHGRPFKLKEHVERFYRSLRYLRIDPGLSPAEMVAASEEVLERNRHFLTPDTDYWLGQRVSRGVDAVGDEGWEHTGPNVIVECIPLPLKSARPAVPRRHRHRRAADPAGAARYRCRPRAKTHNYLNLIIADLEAKAQDKEAWSVLLDAHGPSRRGHRQQHLRRAGRRGR